jgi:two-component system, LytTR family, sensor kinase
MNAGAELSAARSTSLLGTNARPRGTNRHVGRTSARTERSRTRSLIPIAPRWPIQCTRTRKNRKTEWSVLTSNGKHAVRPCESSLQYGDMKPPADRLLDIQGTGTDLPAQTRPTYGVRWRHVVLVATALGLLSTTLAWQFTRLVGKFSTPFSTLVILNFAWWYVWALMAPTVVWLSQHFKIERGALLRALAVHVPGVVFFSLAHIAGLEAVRWWLAYSEGHEYTWLTQVQRSAVLYFDWEMMTYWAIVGLSHALLYYRESRARALRGAQLETRLIEAQLSALQQQLHPHFLFNTLHAISALMHKDVPAADRVLMQLSDLLRITLEHLGQQEVALEADLSALSKYLQIEQTRFADRLVVRFDVHPDTLDSRVPSLLLQPLVENAIKHGVARKAGLGHIDISARRDGDKLRLEVRDDGVGLSEDALTALQKGIGVSTTRARLQHLFGADFRFEFHRLAQGLAVVIALPWRKVATVTERRSGRGADTPAPAESPLHRPAFRAQHSWAVVPPVFRTP